MTGLAVIHDTSVIDIEGWRETISIVAGATISDCCRVRWHRGAFARCIDTVVIVVTRFAGLHCCIDHVVVEYSTEAEGNDAMTGCTVDIGCRVTCRRITGLVIL